MKFDGKRIAAALLASISLLSPIKAGAAEDEGWLCMEERWAFITPFTVEHTIRTAGGETYFSGTCAPVFGSLSYGGETFPACSADPSAGAAEGVRYRCRNLEDSGGFSDAAAGKLRAILREAYPWQGVETLQERANDWLRARELPEIRDLQSGEAVLAAQVAIWKLTGGERYRVHSLFGGTMDLSGCKSQVESQQELPQTPRESTPGNIESLYTYFCNLAPQAASHILISDSTVTRTRYSGREDGRGSYTVEVAVTIAGDVGEGDRLTISAACGGEIQTQPLPEGGEYRFVFQSLSGRLPVELAVRGEQWGSDVYLFEGEQGDVQSLAGFWNGFLHISWKRVLEPSAVPLWD